MCDKQNARLSAGKTSLFMGLKINDDYLIGFVEGEGTFYIGIVPSPETKSGWQVIYFFKVSQNPSGKMVLDYLKKRLGCGYIKPNHKNNIKRDKSLAYVVRDFPSLKQRVIPFFDNKLVIKNRVFKKFKRILELIEKKQHLNKHGIKKILDLAYTMNTGKRRVTKEKVLASYK